jgi:predicted TIM-barrel fold metal-dependent hydrolase
MTEGMTQHIWDCHAHVFDGVGIAESHYVPATCTLAGWERAAREVGADRVVLVQPSIYGTDNHLLLNALLQADHSARGEHRGIVVVDNTVTDAALDDMHRVGVRGARFNLVSPGARARRELASHALDHTIARLRVRGWHAQFFIEPEALPWLRDRLDRWNIRIVLDHCAGLTPAHLADKKIVDALSEIASHDAWVKLSGFYRLGVRAPYRECAPVIELLVSHFRKRVVWASDWPHTWFKEATRDVPVPTFDELIAPVRKSLTADELIHALHTAPAILYR